MKENIWYFIIFALCAVAIAALIAANPNSGRYEVNSQGDPIYQKPIFEKIGDGSHDKPDTTFIVKKVILLEDAKIEYVVVERSSDGWLLYAFAVRRIRVGERVSLLRLKSSDSSSLGNLRQDLIFVE